MLYASYSCVLYFPFWIVLFVLFTLSSSAAFVTKPSILNNKPQEWNVRPPKNINKLNELELKTFYNSFDVVLIDINEFLWRSNGPASKAAIALKKLQFSSKDIIFVTSNNIYPVKHYIQYLDKLKYYAVIDQFITPSETIAWYLRHTGFKGKALTLGTELFKADLMTYGINIITGPSSIEENFELLENLTHIDKNVKAVILDFDVNANWVKMLLAGAYLQNKDVLFLTGTSSKKLPVSELQTVIGPGYFQDILIDYTGRTPTSYTKPGSVLKNFIFHKYNITNASRVLFMGNSLETDMKFAELCGFTKIWIGTEMDLKHSCGNGCEAMPDYYLLNVDQIPIIDFNH